MRAPGFRLVLPVPGEGALLGWCALPKFLPHVSPAFAFVWSNDTVNDNQFTDFPPHLLLLGIISWEET